MLLIRAALSGRIFILDFAMDIGRNSDFKICEKPFFVKNKDLTLNPQGRRGGAIMPSQTTQKTISRGAWVKMTPAEVIAFSDNSKQLIKRKVDEIIERHMKPTMLKGARPRPSPGDIEDVYTKWHGHSLILLVKRRGGVLRNKRVEDFETKSGRLTLTGVDAFDVSYFRHTGRWWTIQQGCTLKAALEYFRKPGPLWPW